MQVSVCVSDICSENLSKMPYWVITQEIRRLLALFTGNQSKMKSKNLQIRSTNEKLKTQKKKVLDKRKNSHCCFMFGTMEYKLILHWDSEVYHSKNQTPVQKSVLLK